MNDNKLNLKVGRPTQRVANRIQRSGEVDRFLKDIWTRNENIAYAY
jgi:hypothetical protein